MWMECLAWKQAHMQARYICKNHCKSKICWIYMYFPFLIPIALTTSPVILAPVSARCLLSIRPRAKLSSVLSVTRIFLNYFRINLITQSQYKSWFSLRMIFFKYCMQFTSVCSKFLFEHVFLARTAADGRRPGCAVSKEMLEFCWSLCQTDLTFTVQQMSSWHLQKTKDKWNFPFQILAKATLKSNGCVGATVLMMPESYKEL